MAEKKPAGDGRSLEAVQPARPHSLQMDNRTTLKVTGVLRVLACDDTGVTMRTPQGDLTVGGQELQVGELSVRSGELQLSGKINYLQYSENKESAGGLLARLFS